MRTLVIFVSRQGCSERSARLIRRMLGDDCDIANLESLSGLDLGSYDTVVLGGPIYFGRMHRAVRDFCKRYREQLLTRRLGLYICCMQQGEAAAQELLAFVLAWLGRHAPEYRLGASEVERPDGEIVAVDQADPMGTLGHLVQEDLCLMEKRGAEHHLTAAVLCFPASWRLSDKIGRPLTDIHVPVPEYDAGIARRVQRLFDGVQVDRPLWRFNALGYAEAALFQPRSRTVAEEIEARNLPYLRSERQCVLRLPETRACVFSIHTFVVKR